MTIEEFEQMMSRLPPHMQDGHRAAVYLKGGATITGHYLDDDREVLSETKTLVRITHVKPDEIASIGWSYVRLDEIAAWRATPIPPAPET